MSEANIVQEVQYLLTNHGPRAIEAIIAIGLAADAFFIYERSINDGIQSLINTYGISGNFMTQVWEGRNVNLPFPELGGLITQVYSRHLPDLINVWSQATGSLDYFANNPGVLPLRYTQFLCEFYQELLANLNNQLEQQISFSDYLVRRNLFISNAVGNITMPTQHLMVPNTINRSLLPGLVIPTSIGIIWYLAQNLYNMIRGFRGRLSTYRRRFIPNLDDFPYLERSWDNMIHAHVNPHNMRSVMNDNVRSLERIYEENQQALTELQVNQQIRELNEEEINMLNSLNNRIGTDLTNLNNARESRRIQLQLMEIIESELE